MSSPSEEWQNLAPFVELWILRKEIIQFGQAYPTLSEIER